ncbi:hypothetical protein F5Y06DRAFT_299013 [Hypoxylon sp. FL0890]|nr:hypothetical protein F5Y06DRAFT_299013 [Hypoxylon sp. FL0890]
MLASSIYEQISAKGAARIKRAFDSVRRRNSQNDIFTMKEQYNLCTQPSNQTQAKYILAGFLAAFSYLYEFNWPPFVLGEQNTIPFPAEAAINDIAALKAPFDDSEPILIAVDYYTQLNGAPCLDWGDADTLRGLTAIFHPDGYSTADSIFGLMAPENSTNNALDSRCQADYGMNASDGGIAHQEALKTIMKDVLAAERLIVSTGEYV